MTADSVPLHFLKVHQMLIEKVQIDVSFITFDPFPFWHIGKVVVGL